MDAARPIALRVAGTGGYGGPLSHFPVLPVPVWGKQQPTEDPPTRGSPSTATKKEIIFLRSTKADGLNSKTSERPCGRRGVGTQIANSTVAPRLKMF